VDVDVGQLDAPHHHAAQVDAAEPGAGQVDGAQFRAAEVNALQPRATKISTNEVSHATTLTAHAGDPPQGGTTEPSHAAGGNGEVHGCRRRL
jgi:hypothetical protein